MKNFDFKRLAAFGLCAAVTVAVTGVFTVVFALIMNAGDIDLKYAPVFATASISLGVLAGAYYLSSKKGNKGLLRGMCVGGVAFVLITLIGLIINDGSIGLNTLFHLIIIVLSAGVGGVLGVNKRDKKYI